jgi:adenylate cyclase
MSKRELEAAMSGEVYRRERRVVMFTDIRRFARLFQSGDPRLMDFIQEYYELSGDHIVRGGGQIIKYIGDSVLSLFPEGAEKEAVRCAVETESDFKALVEKHGLDPEVSLDAGISSGEVYIGVIGHRSLRHSDVFGETVNKAAILTRGEGVIIDEVVHRAAGGVFRTTKLPDVPLKWRPEPIRAWRVEGGSNAD